MNGESCFSAIFRNAVRNFRSPASAESGVTEGVFPRPPHRKGNSSAPNYSPSNAVCSAAAARLLCRVNIRAFPEYAKTFA